MSKLDKSIRADEEQINKDRIPKTHHFELKRLP